MSRTYKDRPSHIKEADPKHRKKSIADHGCGFTPYWSRKPAHLPCDLNETHERQGAQTHTKNCEYVPYGMARGMSWWDPYKVTKSTRHFFWRDARNENRKLTKEMVDEYNSCGIIEDSYVFTPYKKNALFGGGYTD